MDAALPLTDFIDPSFFRLLGAQHQAGKDDVTWRVTPGKGKHAAHHITVDEYAKDPEEIALDGQFQSVRRPVGCSVESGVQCTHHPSISRHHLSVVVVACVCLTGGGVVVVVVVVVMVVVLLKRGQSQQPPRHRTNVPLVLDHPAGIPTTAQRDSSMSSNSNNNNSGQRRRHSTR